jgi:myo-inositol-1(or 4)-monophosphatase
MAAPQALVHELLVLANAMALEAGALLAERQPQVRELVGTKSTPTDMVTEVDREAEALLVRRILSARPHDAILGEEGAYQAGTSGVRWVLDPLDGTTNYLYGYPAYAVSIGVEADGVTVAGVVHDAARGETYTATLGGGAFINGRRLAVSNEERIPHALLGTGFGYDIEGRRKQAAVVARLLPQVRDIRRSGSAALDLCSVAAGRLDAYYEFGLNEWDRAAGILIVQEAGGLAEVTAGGFGLELNLASGTALFRPLEALVRGAVAALTYRQ